jgi:hypothetical protein
VYARKCKIIEVSTVDAKKFLNENHVQGYTTSTTRLGLEYNNELVALMCFSTSRIGIGSRESGYELVRYASSTRVVGGASKLLSHFTKLYNPEKIFSYSDNEWSTGDLYKTLGFNLEREVKPSYWYVKPREEKMYHRYNFAKYRLVEMGYDAKQIRKRNNQRNGIIENLGLWQNEVGIEMLDKIKQLISGKNSKNFHRIFKNYPNILEFLETSTVIYNPKNLNEQLYIVLNNPPLLKSCGKYPQFNTFELGYRDFCGNKVTCACARTYQSEKISENYKNIDSEKLKEIQEKTRKTNFEKYGVDNPAKNAESY